MQAEDHSREPVQTRSPERRLPVPLGLDPPIESWVLSNPGPSTAAWPQPPVLVKPSPRCGGKKGRGAGNGDQFRPTGPRRRDLPPSGAQGDRRPGREGRRSAAAAEPRRSVVHGPVQVPGVETEQALDRLALLNDVDDGAALLNRIRRPGSAMRSAVRGGDTHPRLAFVLTASLPLPHLAAPPRTRTVCSPCGPGGGRRRRPVRRRSIRPASSRRLLPIAARRRRR